MSSILYFLRHLDAIYFTIMSEMSDSFYLRKPRVTGSGALRPQSLPDLLGLRKQFQTILLKPSKSMLDQKSLSEQVEVKCGIRR